MKLKYRVIERFRGKYSIEAMCEVFEGKPQRILCLEKPAAEQTAKDQWLVDLVVACQTADASRPMAFAAFDAGFSARPGKLVNVKAILRVMRKLNLLSVVRRRRPYTRYQQAVHKYPNLLDRNFDQAQAQSVLGNGHHLHPDSGQHAVHVRCAGFVWKGRPCVEDRR